MYPSFIEVCFRTEIDSGEILALLADSGASGRLTTWRATRVASCSAASWGLETLSPPGAAAAERIGKTGVCTRTGAATAWCSGARRA